jgi:hypothetical protein
VAFGGTGGYSCSVIFEKTAQTAVIVLSIVSAFLSAKGDYTPAISFHCQIEGIDRLLLIILSTNNKKWSGRWEAGA